MDSVGKEDFIVPLIHDMKFKDLHGSRNDLLLGLGLDSWSLQEGHQEQADKVFRGFLPLGVELVQEFNDYGFDFVHLGTFTDNRAIGVEGQQVVVEDLIVQDDISNLSVVGFG